MTAQLGASRPIDLVRDEIQFLGNNYKVQKEVASIEGYRRNLIGLGGKSYTVSPVFKGCDGDWVLASGFSIEMFKCSHCTPACVSFGNNNWQYKQGD